MDVDTVGEALKRLWKGRTSLRDELVNFYIEWRELAAKQKQDTADLIHFWTVEMKEEENE